VPRKDRALLVEPAAFGHRILVSTAASCEDETVPAAKQRWGDLRQTDLMFVPAEMLVTEAGRYSCSAVISSRSEVGRLPPTGARRWPASGWWGAPPGGRGPST
jgi:E3 ubiquitin-protein ligase RNF38/44